MRVAGPFAPSGAGANPATPPPPWRFMRARRVGGDIDLQRFLQQTLESVCLF
ncbi:hypothetical protein [Methylocella sp.]|uniref:hypothetical protein n=1 Tax=Methylocella sp. TaxID=1978226 RepID=UPI003783835C